MKLAIVIPAYNEEKTLKSVLLSLPKQIAGTRQITSIVVNDGSADKTFDLAEKYADIAINHIVNLGVGAATSTGLEAARQIHADIAVTIDADGQHSTKDVKRILKPILEGKADVVIGTRMLHSKGMPALKVFGNWFMNFLTFLVFQKWSSDSQSGLKAFSARALKKMKLNSLGYEICSEVIGEIRRNGLRLTEIPIEVIYSDYSKLKGQNWLNGINVFTRMLVIKIVGKQ